MQRNDYPPSSYGAYAGGYDNYSYPPQNYNYPPPPSNPAVNGPSDQMDDNHYYPPSGYLIVC